MEGPIVQNRYNSDIMKQSISSSQQIDEGKLVRMAETIQSVIKLGEIKQRYISILMHKYPNYSSQASGLDAAARNDDDDIYLF